MKKLRQPWFPAGAGIPAIQPVDLLQKVHHAPPT
jgi:hypothetical protein